jgi:phosphoglycolate phosphatase
VPISEGSAAASESETAGRDETPAPLVIFDLDGTLVDTAPDLIDSLNHTIEAVGMQPVTFDDVTYLVGQGVKVMITRAFELRRTALDEATFTTLFDRFMAHYAAHMPGKSRPYPGAETCLSNLAAAGFGLAVCTNKAEELARPLIDRLGLTDRFPTITGGNTFAVRKPDAGHIFGTIEKAGASKNATVMVGDSINDILAARNANIPSIAVRFGYSDVPAEELGADRIVDHFDEITPALIRDLIAASA